jgi:PAS domain S-box-containing protein
MAAKINDHVRNLESIVRERTSELDVANERLMEEVSDRKQVEEELQKARDELEQRVEVRTFELMELNDNLKLEIEERKRAEEALRSSEEKYRSTFEGTPDSITITEMKTDQYIEVNDGFCQMTGYTRKEVLGNTPLDLNIFGNPEDRERIVEILRQEGEVNGFSLKHRMKDGTLFDTLFSARPILYGGKDCLVAVVKDITPLKRAEEEKGKLQAQLQHYQRMESIGTIASGMAHNFRNILAGISVNSQLLQMRHKNDQGITDLGESINSSVAKGSALVQGLMQFSRKQGTEALGPVNLVDVIREVDNLISKSFDKRINIRVNVPETLYVVGDQVGLSQILMNLCTNARDAMPEGGTLQIEARKERDKAVVVVSDNGHGMDRETQEKCFYPFFTTKDPDKGTGLGLSTTYGIIREHNGDVHVYSEPGKGTTFRLYFPLALSETMGTGEPMPGPVLGAGQKILIVDDEKEIATPLEEMLIRLGYRASAVGSGIAAIEKYGTWRPDAVLLDRSMPQMDGITCAKKILEVDTNAKIIMISGYEEKGMNGIERETRSRIKGYFTKPVKMEELSQFLADLFK